MLSVLSNRSGWADSRYTVRPCCLSILYKVVCLSLLLGSTQYGANPHFLEFSPTSPDFSSYKYTSYKPAQTCPGPTCPFLPYAHYPQSQPLFPYTRSKAPSPSNPGAQAPSLSSPGPRSSAYEKPTSPLFLSARLLCPSLSPRVHSNSL